MQELFSGDGSVPRWLHQALTEKYSSSTRWRSSAQHDDQLTQQVLSKQRRSTRKEAVRTEFLGCRTNARTNAVRRNDRNRLRECDRVNRKVKPLIIVTSGASVMKYAEHETMASYKTLKIDDQETQWGSNKYSRTPQEAV